MTRKSSKLNELQNIKQLVTRKGPDFLYTNQHVILLFIIQKSKEEHILHICYSETEKEEYTIYIPAFAVNAANDNEIDSTKMLVMLGVP